MIDEPPPDREDDDFPDEPMQKAPGADEAPTPPPGPVEAPSDPDAHPPRPSQMEGDSAGE
jgi:hypothetical protein